MRDLKPDQQKLILDAMQITFSRGSFPCLRSFIKDYGELFLSSSSSQIREEYLALVEAAQEGFAYEEIHGRYSLLKLEHPANQLLVSKGIVEDPARQLEVQDSEGGGRVVGRTSIDVIGFRRADSHCETSK